MKVITVGVVGNIFRSEPWRFYRHLIKEIIAEAQSAPAITPIYAARDTEHNEAVVLRAKLRRFTSGPRRSA